MLQVQHFSSATCVLGGATASAVANLSGTGALRFARAYGFDCRTWRRCRQRMDAHA